MSQLIEDAGGGLVVPPEDGLALADAVRQLADMDDADWERMSRAGYDYVVSNYTWDRISERWLNGLQSES